jgi:hypothetical protein
MKTLFGNPKTTVGGLIALAAVAGLLAHSIDQSTAMVLLGLAGAWMGIVAKDGGPQ